MVLVCRSLLILLRLDRALLVAGAPAALNRVGHAQGFRTYQALNHTRRKSGVKFTESEMNKKRKSVNPVWRPVNTQSASDGEENESVGHAAEVENVVEHTVVLDNQSAVVGVSTETAISPSAPENIVEVVQADGVLAVSTSSSIVFQDKDELKDAEELADSITTSILLDSTGNRDAAGVAVSRGSHSASLTVGASVMRFIRGKSGYIEEETGVKLIFPLSKKEHSITIEGKCVDSIAKASERIQTIIDMAVNSPSLEYSHFISLPLAIHPELVDKLVRFRTSILQDFDFNDDEHNKNESDTDGSEDEVQQTDKALGAAIEPKFTANHEHGKVDSTLTTIPLVSYAPKALKSRPNKASKSASANTSPSKSGFGIDRSIFINPKTFHLTVLMLKLWNEERVHSATEVFQRISSQVIEALDGRPVFVRFKGLDCMKGSLANARVLYAPVEETGNEGRLLRACQVIIDAFNEAGLVLEKDATHPLKLHATLMNARHRTRTRSRKVIPFDARGIFKQYGSEEWGDYNIREAHLSQRFKYDENGYYHCCASMPFPQVMQIG